MKKFLLIAILSVGVLTSCEKEKEVTPAKNNSEIIMGGGLDKKMPPNDGGY